jgi:hypothetical protein
MDSRLSDDNEVGFVRSAKQFFVRFSGIRPPILILSKTILND